MENKRVAKAKPKYDPKKAYSWDPDAQITISGKEFLLIREALNQNLSNPEFIKHVKIYEALKVIEDVFADSVSEGIIKEQTNEKEGTI